MKGQEGDPPGGRPEDGDEGGIPIDAPGQRRLPPLLRTCWYSLNQAFRRRLTELDLTPNQFTALRWLIENAESGLTQKQLARLMASDPNTVASLLGRMERAGWIDRQVLSSDRRAHQVVVSTEGLRIYDVARERAVELQQEVLACMDEAEQEVFLTLLDRFAKSCRTALRQSGP